MNLTVLILSYNEVENLKDLIPKLCLALNKITPASWEILIVEGGSIDQTTSVVEKHGVRVVSQTKPGYGGALQTGIEEARGDFLLTMDADLSHDPSFICKLWDSRYKADIIIASRYCRGGVAYMPWTRKVLSRILNSFFARGLSLRAGDLSSGFRLYRAALLKQMELKGRNFEILEEILIKAHIEGWNIQEIPFTYFPRVKGSSNARILKFGIDYLRTFFRMWKLRNSTEAADYDERAYYSLIPLQRYWQRRRHQIITTLARTSNLTIDVGCGSSVILQSINHGVGVDIRFPKLRYMWRYRLPVVNGTIFCLPFREEVADCVICSEVIEHISMDATAFQELDRILKPGGILILVTPDYGTWIWPTIEWLYRLLIPGGYADEHISHYSSDRVNLILSAMGYEILDRKYILKGELILAARRGLSPFDPAAVQKAMAIALRPQDAIM